MTRREIDRAIEPMLRARMHIPEMARRLGIEERLVRAAYWRAWRRRRKEAEARS